MRQKKKLFQNITLPFTLSVPLTYSQTFPATPDALKPSYSLPITPKHSQILRFTSKHSQMFQYALKHSQTLSDTSRRFQTLPDAPRHSQTLLFHSQSLPHGLIYSQMPLMHSPFTPRHGNPLSDTLKRSQTLLNTHTHSQML